MDASISKFHWPDVDETGQASLPTLCEIYVSITHPDQLIRYEIAVTTAAEFCSRVHDQKLVSGHGQIIMSTFDTTAVEAFIRAEVSKLESIAWEDLELLLRRFGRSEFDTIAHYWSPSPWGE